MELYWLRELSGRMRGPFTRQQIDKMLAAQELKPGAPIWSNQTQAWGPASNGNARAKRPVSFSWLVGLTYFLTLAACIFLVESKWTEVLGAFATAIIWPIAGWGLVASSVGLIVACARPNRFGEARPELAAARAVVAGLLALFGLGAGGIELYLQHDAVVTSAALEGLGYDLYLDASRRALIVKGDIGPGLSDAIETALQSSTSVSTIEITSLGGLTDEGLSAANVIEHRHMRVVARKVCASACLALLMAGEERLADLQTTLDFHATAPLGGLKSARVLRISKKRGVAISDYLKARGVPEDLIAAAERIGPARVQSITALEALDLHILTAVLDGETIVSPELVRERLGGKPRRTVRAAIYDDVY